MTRRNDWEIRMDRYASELASGRVVHWRAPSWLSDYVLGYSGYQVSMTAPVLRRLVPFGGVSVLLDFTPASRVPAESVPGSSARYQFRLPVAGLFDGPVLFSQAGYHFGVAVGLTPAGAYALFGTPMHELTNKVVEVSELAGDRAERLAERLAEAPDWRARFALLDDVLPRWIQAGPVPQGQVARAWWRLFQSSGRVTVGALAEEVGWSSRHLETRFLDQVGVSPKTAARILRFHRAVCMVGGPGRPTWSQVAAACGYTDQAHLNRDFRQFAGCTPVVLLGR
jgi:AraC-like DNA-binding protein